MLSYTPVSGSCNDVSCSSYQTVNAIGQHHQKRIIWLPIKGSDWLGHMTLPSKILHTRTNYTTLDYQLPQCYHVLHQLHHTSLLLHGATPYISVTTQSYTIRLYYYTVLHHTSLLLHRATPHISITTRSYTIHLYYYTVLHHTSLA